MMLTLQPVEQLLVCRMEAILESLCKFWRAAETFGVFLCNSESLCSACKAPCLTSFNDQQVLLVPGVWSAGHDLHVIH